MLSKPPVSAVGEADHSGGGGLLIVFSGPGEQGHVKDLFVMGKEGRPSVFKFISECAAVPYPFVIKKALGLKFQELYFLVPGAGIEPARHLVPRDFKSLASTISATRAFGIKGLIPEMRPIFKI